MKFANLVLLLGLVPVGSQGPIYVFPVLILLFHLSSESLGEHPVLTHPNLQVAVYRTDHRVTE